MVKHIHEIRDPIHVFVRLDSNERKVVDSRPFQRLRHIHQLALTYMVYPGATHSRFEHSLGVMELAGRVYSVVTNDNSLARQEIRDLLPHKDELSYWRRVVRLAGLCHDLGHLPFSHAAEKELLPDGWDHERLTREIILSDEMKLIWNGTRPQIAPEDVVKVALGPKGAKGLEFSVWETILSEIIVGDAFGVDRMDYLLRDSLHAGVPYGKFDHYRLIDCLRILPSPPSKQGEEEGALRGEPTLGLDIGGIHTAEALLWARYLMFSQLYFHPIRRIYDIHLKDFLCEWLEGGKFSTNVDDLLKISDNEVNVALLEAVSNPNKAGHDPATHIINHKHFKCIYHRHPDDVRINPDAGLAVFNRAEEEFGEEIIRYDKPPAKRSATDFPVITNDERISSSLSISEPMRQVPLISLEYVFVDRDIFDKANKWLKDNREEIIKPSEEAEE